MSDFDEMALAQARDVLLTMAGVEVLSEWRPLPNSVWMLKLRLDLLGAEPTPTLPSSTEWEVVVDFSRDSWGKVQLHPALGEQGLSATFNHQMFNGGSHAKWACRNGHICTPSWFSLLAKNRGAVQDEPGPTLERVCWHVARALDWLTMAATGQLTQPGDLYELPDFTGSKASITSLLAYYEDGASYEWWQSQSAQSGIVRLAIASNIFVTHRFMDASDRQPVYEPAWGKALAAAPAKDHVQALWIRLDEVPLVNGYQAPATIAELQEALANQGKDLFELLEPLWKAYQLGKEAFALLLVGMPVAKRVGEAPYRY